MATEKALVQADGVVFNHPAATREAAVLACGEVLVKLGAVDRGYVEAMWQREQKYSSAIGLGFAVPHGTDESRKFVRFDQLAFVRFVNPIQWLEETVEACVAIASRANGHVELLANLASLLLNEDHLNQLKTTLDRQEVLLLLNDGGR